MSFKKDIEESHFYQRYINEIVQSCTENVLKDEYIHYSLIESAEKDVQKAVGKLYAIGYYSEKKVRYIAAKAFMKIAEIRYIASKIEFFRANKALTLD